MSADTLPGPWDRDPTDLGLTPPPPDPEPHSCDGGWLDRDAARPCLDCRPWLRRAHDHRTGTTAWRPHRAHAPSTPGEAQ